MLLPTPEANTASNGGSQDPDKRRAGGHSVNLQDVVEHQLLPTPRVSSANGASQREVDAGNPKGRLETEVVVLFPTPRATDGEKGGPNQRGSSGDLMLPSAVLLGTPAARDYKGTSVDGVEERAARGSMEAQVMLLPTPSASDGEGGKTSRSGARKDEPLLGGIGKLLPTPTAMDSEASGGATNADVTLTDAAVRGVIEWGVYSDAIHQWETITHPAPAPTEPGPKGQPRLSPRFSEWMMGVPPGHITDTPDLSRNDQLRACGNGVVPQQAAHGYATLLAMRERWTQ